ncbi:hypothetical protein N8I74_08050 [Chitiniphilus purpureus]|uniref:Uncharacterized protein n=1 Tax=Chitiniphilus purpureus TaxID=2981137 RepID=A0ABY6DRE6_9NEIS|nr:hypothetical protein [Chitiniphilus sp. CD1]UXY16950.1 hypothetical protein N8I74_08050 [Chitiniphilus sp. CD1]
MRKAYWLLGLLMVMIIGAGFGYTHLQRKTEPSAMKKPLVFIIPEGYFGPVFIFYGQQDGVASEPDPLGQAVRVPPNGVIKAKFSADEVPTGDASPTYRPVWYVVEKKDGSRFIPDVLGWAGKNEDGYYEVIYLDGKGKLRTFVDKHPKETKEEDYGLWSNDRHAPTIRGRESCTYQGFNERASEQFAGEITAKEAGAPACDKFFVVSHHQFKTLPRWMWEAPAHPYGSIAELEAEADARLEKRQAYYQTK